MLKEVDRRCPHYVERELSRFPTCGGQRMTERAARWVDERYPIVAVRQWVLTVPWPRRLLGCPQTRSGWTGPDPELARGVLRVA